MKTRLRQLFEGIKITDWITALSAFSSVFFGIWVISQNTATIKTANEALRLSLTPTVGIEYPSTKKPGTFTIQNTGTDTISSVEVFPSCYLITTNDAREIIQINHSSSLLQPAQEKLEIGKQIPLSALRIMEACPIPEPSNTSANRFLALIVVFKREIDNKRFVHIEPFGGTIENGQPIAVPYYQSTNSAMGGGRNVYGVVTSIKKIEELEKTFFRADK